MGLAFELMVTDSDALLIKLIIMVLYIIKKDQAGVT